MRVFYIICVSFFVCTNITVATELASSDNNYTSVFDSYQNWELEGFGDWRLANDSVGEIGGWQFYSREQSLKEQNNSAELMSSGASKGGVK